MVKKNMENVSSGLLKWFDKSVCMPIVRKALVAHGLSKNVQAWKSGSYSDVYKLKDDKLLRITSIPVEKYPNTDKFAALAKNVEKKSGDLMPMCFSEELHKVQSKDESIYYGMLRITVIEHVQAIPFERWHKHFATPNALLLAVLETGNKLFARKVVHRDISDGNILLNSKTMSFQFIDNDDACIYPRGIMCKVDKVDNIDYGFGTPGYTLPGIDGNDTTFKAHMALYHTITGFPVRQHEVAESERLAYKTNPELQILHNMVHALVIVAMQAIVRSATGKAFVRKKSNWNKLPQDWQTFLARVCTPVAPDRYDFDSAIGTIRKLTPLVWTEKGVTIRRDALARRSSPLLSWSKPTATRPSSPTLQNPLTGRMILIGKQTHHKLCVAKQLPKRLC
jgi:serine/threonine protein kinase